MQEPLPNTPVHHPLHLSIITVSLNSSKTIGDALQSVAEQTYPYTEHIIVDGGSDDDTMHVVNSYPHVAKKISEKDEGIYFAMNKGIAMASGDIIGILNADDMYAGTEVLQKVADAFQNPDIDAVYADLVFVHPQNTKKIVRYWQSRPHQPSDFYNGWMPPHPTFFVRKSMYEKYGLFDTRLRSAADYELMLRFLLKYKIRSLHIPQTFILMRNGGKSTASLKNRLIANREDRQAWKINGLNPQFFTLILKPVRKINQYFLNG
jgi:glycosyltransferase involved in cell wall biosynthesis